MIFRHRVFVNGEIKECTRPNFLLGSTEENHQHQWNSKMVLNLNENYLLTTGMLNRNIFRRTLKRMSIVVLIKGGYKRFLIDMMNIDQNRYIL